MQEIWKDIEGYEGIYQVSNLGRVKSLNRTIEYKDGRKKLYTERVLSQQKYRSGYLGIKLYKNNVYKRIQVHRLVASAFIPNNKGLPYINHKNGIKTDNKVENLEYCTPSYNVQHAWNNGLNVMSESRQNNNRRNGLKTAKKVEQYNLNNEKVGEYNSLREAGRLTKIRYDHISECCKRIAKTAGGYIWKYKEEQKCFLEVCK